jgi:glycosyltransferase involved in cell wall biosynthesis
MSASQPAGGIAVAIPSYRRGRVLIETLEHVLALRPRPAEVLVVDQTEAHPADVAERLGAWSEASQLRWARRSEPSIPAAMNAALQQATARVVLFLDDDVVPEAGLLGGHARAHAWPGRLVAGRVVQPWDEPAGPATGDPEELPRLEDWLRLVIGANFSVDRAAALAAGGFDENFVGTAYRFEADFARRFAAAGGVVLHAPAASVRHLRAAGGTRAGSRSLFRIRLRQAQGEYYFWLRAGRFHAAAAALARRPFTAITDAHRRRWLADRAGAVPAECLALLQAARRCWRGPRLIAAGRT